MYVCKAVLAIPTNMPLYWLLSTIEFIFRTNSFFMKTNTSIVTAYSIEIIMQHEYNYLRFRTFCWYLMTNKNYVISCYVHNWFDTPQYQSNRRTHSVYSQRIVRIRKGRKRQQKLWFCSYVERNTNEIWAELRFITYQL